MEGLEDSGELLMSTWFGNRMEKPQITLKVLCDWHKVKEANQQRPYRMRAVNMHTLYGGEPT